MFKTKEMIVSLQTHSWTGELLATRRAISLGTVRGQLDKLMDKKNQVHRNASFVQGIPELGVYLEEVLYILSLCSDTIL